MAGRPFGCEFEFSSELEEMEPIVRGAIAKNRLLVSKSYLRSINNKRWHLKFDSSTGAELASPVSTLKDLPAICRVLGLVAKGGARTGKNDGFHVHVFAGDMDVEKAIAAWLRVESTMLSLVPPHRRRGNTYCTHLLGNKTPPAALLEAKELATNHHAAFSTKPMASARKTVEFRLAEGTMDPEFVRHWVRLCLALVDWAKGQPPYDLLLGEPKRLDLDEMALALGLPDSTLEFLRKRQQGFSPKSRRAS